MRLHPTALLFCLATSPVHATSEWVLHSFGVGHDGKYPNGTLVLLNDRLYGTTQQGGLYHQGTVFSLTTAGDEKILHSFEASADASSVVPHEANGAPLRGASTDGVQPNSGLVALNGALYGTTSLGGGANAGVVFRTGIDGQTSVVYAFQGGADGAAPNALIALNGMLFGTTQAGGTGGGTLFSLTPAGTHNVLHQFSGAEGQMPNAPLAAIGTTLYGTAAAGGLGYGTAFAVSLSGAVTVLHTFQSAHDGQFPQAGLAAVNGSLLGTTAAGGAGNTGTVFGLTADGTETVLHSFVLYARGVQPMGGLAAAGSDYYGTTEAGGLFGGDCGNTGCGIVYVLRADGTQSILHSFGGGLDGAAPAGQLTQFGRRLFGATLSGGNNHAGTIFGIVP